MPPPVRAYKQLSIHYHHDREIHQYAATSGYVHTKLAFFLCSIHLFTITFSFVMP